LHNEPGYVCPFCPEKERKYSLPGALLKHVRKQDPEADLPHPRLSEVLEHRPPNFGGQKPISFGQEQLGISATDRRSGEVNDFTPMFPVDTSPSRDVSQIKTQTSSKPEQKENKDYHTVATSVVDKLSKARQFPSNYNHIELEKDNPKPLWNHHRPALPWQLDRGTEPPFLPEQRQSLSVESGQLSQENGPSIMQPAPIDSSMHLDSPDWFGPPSDEMSWTHQLTRYQTGSLDGPSTAQMLNELSGISQASEMLGLSADGLVEPSYANFDDDTSFFHPDNPDLFPDHVTPDAYEQNSILVCKHFTLRDSCICIG
jgi:hypothetical protein